MSICEKCWADVFIRAKNNPSKSQTEYYMDLLEERKDNPCKIKGDNGGNKDTGDEK